MTSRIGPLMALTGLLLGCSSRETPSVAALRFQIRAPHVDNGHKLPAMMVFGGFEEAGKVLELIPPRDDLVLASFDYPYAGPRRFRFPETVLDAVDLRRSVARTVTGISELRAQLATHPRVDPNRIGVIGASFGTPFAIAAAARDPEIRFLVVVHGFAKVESAIANRLRAQTGWPLTDLLAWLIQSAVSLPEPSVEAPKLREHQRVLVFAAERDQMIAAESTQALREALARSKASVRWLTTPGGHVGGGNPGLIDRMVSETAKALAEEAPLSEAHDAR